MDSRTISIMYLTKYDQMGASSRYRSLQYLPLLREAGISCSVSPLFDSAYLRRRYGRGGGSVADLCRALWRRLAVLVSARRYDLLFIEKELLPYFPPCLESLLCSLGIPYLVDYDDALFHNYDRSRSLAVRSLFGGKIASVMRKSSTVIAGNVYLADYARRSGASRVEILPTVIDLDRYPETIPPVNSRFTIGWIGSPSTSVYVREIADALAEICRDGGARVVLVGSGPVRIPGVDVEILPWSEASEVADISSFDVGIMPLPDTPWARGKCGFKLIQYMACALPVVASPVGVNRDIVEEGENGYLARSRDEWVRALTALRNDRERRVRMGRAGREKVERQYCLQVVAPKLVEIIKDVAGSKL